MDRDAARLRAFEMRTAGWGDEYLYAADQWHYTDAMMKKQKSLTNDDDGNPKFGRLLIVLLLVVVFMGVLTWFMEVFFPDFGI